MLAGIAKHLRHRRFENGALRIDNVKVSFRIDEFGLPVDAHEYQRKEANELIEEYMLLANISVAGKIASGLPDQALLRRHESPIDRRLEAFVGRMKRLGIELDSTSSGALMKSIAQVTDPEERLTLQHLSTRSMLRAKYFCTGLLDISKYGHYALNVPLYTHFTSPIRRYADIIVHRELEAVLLAQQAGAEAKFPLDPESVSKIAQTCNVKKDAARQAQEQSQHLFLCVLIDDLTKRYGPVVRYGTVIGVLDQAFDVLVSEFGVEKRVHVDQMPVEVCCPCSARNLDLDADSLCPRRAQCTTSARTRCRSSGRGASTSSRGSPSRTRTSTCSACAPSPSTIRRSWKPTAARARLSPRSLTTTMTTR